MPKTYHQNERRMQYFTVGQGGRLAVVRMRIGESKIGAMSRRLARPSTWYDYQYGTETFSLPLHCFSSFERALMDYPKISYAIGKAIGLNYES